MKPASPSFREAFATAFLVPPREQYVALFEAYFDESGTHRGSAGVAVAGYIARPEQWIAFDEEWRKALADNDLDFFHMADCEAGAQLYRGWSRERRESLFVRLADITNKHALASIGCVIDRPDYEKHAPRQIQRLYGGLYGVAASICGQSAAAVAKQLSDDPWIEFVFEHAPKDTGAVAGLFRDNMIDPERREAFRVKGCRFSDKRDTRPLQAADILAYEMFRLYSHAVGADERPIREAHQRKLAELKLRRWGFLEEDELRKYGTVLPRWLALGNKPPGHAKIKKQKKRR